MGNVAERIEKEAMPDAIPGYIDLSLLEDSLAMTPWERMRANDDAVNFAETLRAAMQERHAKPD